MRKLALLLAVLILSAGIASSAMAALANGTKLHFDPGVVSGSNLVSGTGFSMEVSPGFYLWTGMTEADGITLGETCVPNTCPPGTVCNPTPGCSVDQPWLFSGNGGVHGYDPAITDNGDGSLDFSGWFITWNGIPRVSLGGDPANFPMDTQSAPITIIGTRYTLNYAAHVPLGDPSGFGGVPYGLHMEGTIVPEPASLLLLGSGFLGILGLTKMKRP